MNLAYKTVCVVQFPPNVIAAACIYLAAHQLNYPLPVSPPQGGQQLPWWSIMGVQEDDMRYVAACVYELKSNAAADSQIDYAYLQSVTKKIH